MTPERWQQIDRLFHLALEQPQEERAGFLAAACGGDEAVRREVEALIAAQEQTGEFLDTPAYEVAGAKLEDDLLALIVGQTVGHYKILGTLGVGAMGEVYLAQDARLGRKVALKLLSATFIGEPDRLRRFEQEARAASALNHPNILTIHEIGSENGLQFIATEYIDGETLRQHLRQRRLKITEALRIAIEVAEALTAAHAEGIVHRDIKPENVMLRKDGRVKVLDFGLAKLADSPNTTFPGAEASTLLAPLQTTPGLIMGTVAYMSPEQARGLPVDVRTDIWSLGVLLYEMVAGKAPFDGATSSDLIASLLKTEPPPLAQHKKVPTRLEQIVAKALRKETEERYQTATELLDDLKSLKQQLEFESQREPSVGLDSSEPAVEPEGPEGTAVDTDRELWIRTGQQRTPDRTTRATYLADQFKRHKRTAIVALVATLGVAVTVATGWNGLFGGKRTVPGISARIFRDKALTKLIVNGNPVIASISPDGRYVAYALEEAGKQSLWVRQVEIASNHQIISPAEVEYQGVEFSPDGNFVYYVTFNNKSGAMLYRVPVLGGIPAKVIEDLAAPKLSPDGSQIVFKRFSQDHQEEALMIANSDGSGVQKLISRQAPAFFGWWYRSGPAWSPDGKAIVCAVGVSDAQARYMNVLEFSIADRRERLLSSQRWFWIGRVAWLSDGSGLIMTASNKESSFEQLWLLSYPGGEARRLTDDLSSYWYLSMTEDSSALVTVQKQEVVNFWSAPKDDLGHASQITSGAGRYFDLSATPDGKIVYASDAGGNAQIWEMEADGNGKKQLTSGAGRNYGPATSPDGRYIVFHSNRSGSIAGPWNIWRMDRDGGNQKQLTNGDGENSFAQCSPDGKWVVYGSSKVSIDGGEPVQLSDKAIGRPAISPDGKLIAGWYSNDGSASPRIAIIPFAGGKPVQILDIPASLTIPGPYPLPLRWTRDGRAVTYVAIQGASPTSPGVANIWSQSLVGGKPVQLTDFKTDKIYSFDWAPDGRLVLSRGVESNDVVLIKDVR